LKYLLLIKGKNVVILDDMIDTAGTICKAADIMMSKGANSVIAIASHAVLSGPAYERIKESRICEVIVTDTIPLNTSKDTSKFTVLTCSELFADVIKRVYEYKEISSKFIF